MAEDKRRPVHPRDSATPVPLRLANQSSITPKEYVKRSNTCQDLKKVAGTIVGVPAVRETLRDAVRLATGTFLSIAGTERASLFPKRLRNLTVD